MDTAMRDLDQLRERGDETTGRKLGLFAMAGVLSVSAVFAMGIMVGRDGGESAQKASDPLSQLTLPAAKAEGAKIEPVQRVEVRPEALSFPSTLVDREDDDSLIEATVRAAEAELARPAAVPVQVPNVRSAGGVPPIPVAPPPTVADLPAAAAVSDRAQHLEHVAQHDELVARALPEARDAPSNLAPQGREGAYTLQVVSYESERNAQGFADTLRARGHKAFVAAADVPGRGRFYRVRVGPFSTRQEAVGYQDSFENSEHMHTILVANGDK